MQKSQGRDPGSHLPLKPDVFLILTILARDDQYGYGIMQAAKTFSGGRVRIQAGALYRRLKWMLNEGLIREREDPPARAGEGERRRYYRITAFGREVAESEARRMDAYLAAAREASLLPYPEPARES
jgi:DNA-binding PadR family transcriptional regulator